MKDWINGGISGALVTIGLFAITLLAVNFTDITSTFDAIYQIPKLSKVCRSIGIVTNRIDWIPIVKFSKRYAKLFDHDWKLVVAIAMRESHLSHKAVNFNSNGTIDRGLMQINTIWDDIIMTHALLKQMFGNDIGKIRQVEEFIFNIEHNIFIGCFVLKEKFVRYKTLLDAITRYNGSGHRAEAYAKSVVHIYGLICKEY